MFSKRSIALFGIFISVFTNSLMFTVIFPIASQMIMYFKLVEDRSETGYWVGLLGGVMMIGRFISSPIWGILCDRWGRKPVMLTGIITTSVLSVLFGMSQSFIWALTIRFLQGLLSPITIVSRTIIAEMYPGKEQASTMSSFTLIGNIGNISGNIIGGMFEESGDSAIIKEGFLKDFPFLLPNLFIAVIGAISLVICIIFLEETKEKEHLLYIRQSRGFWLMINDPLVKQVLIIFCICSFNGTALGELFALWTWADKDDGGFEFTTYNLGILAAITSFLMIFYVKELFGKIVGLYGLSNTITRSSQVFIMLLLIAPIITITRYNEIASWISMIIVNLFCYSCDFISMTSAFIMINNSVKSNERGKVNGFSMSLGNLARGFSPPLFGMVFAKTAKSDLSYPLNFAFSFILLSFCVFSAWLYSKRLNKDLDSAIEDKKITENFSEMVSMSLAEETETS